MKLLDELDQACAGASPLPWVEDDGNVFSKPLSEARVATIMRRLEGSTEPHPDHDRDWPDGWICGTHQATPSFDEDCEFIVRAVNAAPRLTAALRVALKHHADCRGGIPEGMCECGDPLDKHTGAWGNGGAGWLPKACNIGGGMARCECTYPIPAGECSCHVKRVLAALGGT